jgi:DNA-binding response OmpR family regulator
MAATQSRNILLVEDDTDFRQTLAQQLRLHEEFEVEEAGTGEAAVLGSEKTNYNAILLDVNVPDMDGRDVCHVLRRKGIHAPVIMLTGLDGDVDTVLGLDSGANDYVTKPFRLSVLLARLRAQIHQHEMSEDASCTVGPYIFRPAIKVLQRNDGRKDISLSEKENAILKHLSRAGDTVVSCETLYADIWDYSSGLMTHALQTHIYRLRQKIEENPSKPHILVSEQGGYRLVR